MSLTAGARLGPYEIVSPLGAGGMGEVYRAKDGRLNRTVAIKILSDESAADADRRERFEREAKAISALDHPNICALYDVGEHEGTYFLVMPCLEGQTLADRLAKGRAATRPGDQVRDRDRHRPRRRASPRHHPSRSQARQHHADEDRREAARLRAREAEEGGQGRSAIRRWSKGTGIGTLLGTMPYMAPEQIEGRDVDARSDIFSLGAVIYEMVTGQRAFKGDSPASVIGAILKDEPAPIATLQPLTPAVLGHVVSVCLAKDPDERWQSAADIARELKWVMNGARWRDRGATTGLTWWAVAIAAIAILAIGLAAWPALRPAETVPLVVRFPLVPPTNASFSGTRASVPIVPMAISPDGRTVAFVAAEERKRPMLWLRLLDDVTAKPLAGTENASDPFWSPDSSALGFFADGRLKRVNVASSQVQDICEASFSLRGASWSTEGTIVFGDAQAGLNRVSASGGPVTAIPITVVGAQEKAQRWPVFLPDGRQFLYYQRGEAHDRGLYLATIDGGTPKRLLETTLSGLYRTGIYSSSRTRLSSRIHSITGRARSSASP